MKINASSVAMASTRTYSEETVISASSTMVGAGRWSGQRTPGVIVKKGPDSGKNGPVILTNRPRGLSEQLKREQRGQQVNGVNRGQAPEVPDTEEDLQIKVLRRLLEALERMRSRRPDPNVVKTPELDAKMSPRRQKSSSTLISLSSSGVTGFMTGPFSTGMAAGAAVWTRETVVSSFHSESENTAFSTTGIVKTADGRELSFNVQMEMSRSFMESTELYRQNTVRILTDPLVINLDSNVAGVRDQKFLFDLDADGKLDEISFVKQGSGFLALDKNGDGTINDGKELFGTQTGNGFEELAAYDEDGNGWIDENDSIFDKLTIWTKDRNGNDRLIGIGKAGIGAIYLGSQSTDFSLKDGRTNETNAQIRRTGVYLKESGNVGTIQHVDLAM